jgi:MerR family transcriptional regulator, thiopeptide resistance regulator
MAARDTYLVSDVARIAGVSVRTLHHYDEIGLLVPKGRSEAGYRRYDDDDLLRLQQILIGREQGLTLEEVRRSLDDPSFDRRQALLAQKRQLQEHARRTDAMIRSVDAALAILEGEGRPTMDMKQLFDGFDPAPYEAEARSAGATPTPTANRRSAPSATPRRTGARSATSRPPSTPTPPRR